MVELAYSGARSIAPHKMDAVLTYTSSADLKDICAKLARGPAERRALGKKLRPHVVDKHTFTQPAAEILRVIQRCGGVKACVISSAQR